MKKFIPPQGGCLPILMYSWEHRHAEGFKGLVHPDREHPENYIQFRIILRDACGCYGVVLTKEIIEEYLSDEADRQAAMAYLDQPALALDEIFDVPSLAVQRRTALQMETVLLRTRGIDAFAYGHLEDSKSSENGKTDLRDALYRDIPANDLALTISFQIDLQSSRTSRYYKSESLDASLEVRTEALNKALDKGHDIFRAGQAFNNP